MHSDEDPQALARRTYELSVLNDVARTLNAPVELRTLLQRALEKVAELLGLNTGWILLFDELSGEPYPAASLNLPEGLEREPDRMTGWCHCLDSFRKGKFSGPENVGVVRCSRLRKLTVANGDSGGLRYHASIPLRVYDLDVQTNSANGASFKRLGMLNVASDEWRELSKNDLDLLRTIGDVLGIAVERAHLHSRRVDAAQAEERNRIAREIHDTIAQDLAAITYQLEAAEANLAGENDTGSVKSNISAALRLARKGMAEARKSVLDLRAGPLDERTLAEALEELVAESTRSSATAVSFEGETAVSSIRPALELGFYRIAQEALQNAINHADAEHVSVRLNVTLESAELIIHDDGRGFDGDVAGQSASNGRFGLIGMQERARLLGGSCEIRSEAGTGTKIRAIVPLKAGS